MSTCRSCDAPIEWVVTAKGKRMPVDADPAHDGRFQKVSRRATEHGLTPIVRYLNDADAITARAYGIPLYTSHFATCPNANQHRKATT